MKAIHVLAAALALALGALLVYSIERSAWLLALSESGENGATLGLTAAIVIELTAVALILAEGVSELLHDERERQSLRRWAGIGLVTVLSLQGVANVVAGYVRGGGALLALLEGNAYARFAVAAVGLLVSNLAVPVLLLVLAKLAAIVARRMLAEWPERTQERTHAHAPMPTMAYARIADPPAYPEPQPAGMNAVPESIDATSNACPKCGASLDAARWRAARRWGHCKACKHG